MTRVQIPAGSFKMAKFKGNIKNLIGKLEKENKNFGGKKYAVFMPHFCIDLLAKFKGNFSLLTSSTHFETKNTIKEGGKATNSAFALASLEISSAIIAKTNEAGFALLKNFKSKNKLKNLDISHIKTDGKLASTCAIEMPDKNIMLSDAGSLKNFGIALLSTDDFELLKHSEFVSISDWALNEKGTELAEKVFKFAKRNNVQTFFDPGDPTPKIKSDNAKNIKNTKNIAKEIKEILNHTDFLSVNEDEFKFYELGDFKGETKIIEHTANFSSIIKKGETIAKIPSFDVDVKQLTGAGDTFNSGFIFGDMGNFEEKEKLILGNAAAAYYISNPKARHANIKDIIKFLKTAKIKEI